MYLVDTDVISEARKKVRSNPGVRAFFERAREEGTQLYLSVVTIGELRQGVERIRFRGKATGAKAGAVAPATDHGVSGSDLSAR